MTASSPGSLRVSASSVATWPTPYFAAACLVLSSSRPTSEIASTPSISLIASRCLRPKAPAPASATLIGLAMKRSLGFCPRIYVVQAPPARRDRARRSSDLRLQGLHFDFPAVRAHLRQVPTHLHPEPEVGGSAKRLFKTHGHFRGDAVLPANDAVELLSRHAKPFSGLGDGKTKLLDVVLDQTPRMRRVLHARGHLKPFSLAIVDKVHARRLVPFKP